MSDLLIEDSVMVATWADNQQPSFVSYENVSVVAAGQQGPRGETGQIGPAGGASLSKLAQVTLSGHRIVRSVNATEVNYASADTVSHGDDVVGMTFNAAVAGDTVSVLNNAELTEPGWSWTPLEPLYLGNNGLVTQIPPTEGAGATFSLVVGFAISPTTARIRIETPIYL